MDVIDHVAIRVEDIDRAVKWYTDRFDCVVDYRDSTWALIKFANVALALVRPEEHPPHVAVLTPDAGPAAATHRDGTRSVYLADSEGNTIELLERPSESL